MTIKLIMLMAVISFHCNIGIMKENMVENETMNNPYFFRRGIQSVVYKTECSFPITLPEQVNLLIVKLGDNSLGTLYELKLDYDEDSPGRYDYDWDRFWLGYFLVTKDKIYLIQKSDTPDMYENIGTEEELLNMGATIICQEQNREDLLGDSKGFHETITVKGDICKYSGYNNLTETGFYQRFVWKKGVGLVQYLSGYGAMRDHIELNRKRIKDEEMEQQRLAK